MEFEQQEIGNDSRDISTTARQVAEARRADKLSRGYQVVINQDSLPEGGARSQYGAPTFG